MTSISTHTSTRRPRLLMTGLPPAQVLARAESQFDLKLWRGQGPIGEELHIRAVRKFSGFLGRSPYTAIIEDLRRFLLCMVDTGTSPITLNATIIGLKFFFDITLGRGDLMAKMHPVRVPRTLLVVLSREEVGRLLWRKESTHKTDGRRNMVGRLCGTVAVPTVKSP